MCVDWPANNTERQFKCSNSIIRANNVLIDLIIAVICKNKIINKIFDLRYVKTIFMHVK